MNIELLKQRLPNLEILENEPLSRHTTFRIGGPACLLAPADEAELGALLAFLKEQGESPLILGNGSNVLAPDGGTERPVVLLKNMNEVMVNETRLTCGAGCSMARLAVTAWEQGLTGLEFAHGIPGTVGGGVVMNAGAYGGELKDVITSVRCMTLEGQLTVKSGEELDFGYRHSCFSGGGYVITGITVELKPGQPDEIRACMDDLARRRRTSQPLEYPSAGSTFKRPVGYFAGKLVQDCGLKGLTVGGAQVSEKHSGFVINLGGATCRDVLALTDEIRARVKAQTGVELELEVKVL